MNHFFSDINDFLTERFGSPFWLSTIVSWCLWNWKVSVTALFDTENFDVLFLESYFSSTSIYYHLLLPLISGFIYATLSGSLRETLEILAKIIRSKLIEIDQSGKHYKSISVKEYQQKKQALERQISRLFSEVEGKEALQSRNEDLQSRIESLYQNNRETAEIIEEEIFRNENVNAESKRKTLKKLQSKDFTLTVQEDDILEDTNTIENTTKADHKIKFGPRTKNGNDAENEAPNSIKNNPVFDVSFDSLGKKIRAAEGDELDDPNSLKTILATLLLIKYWVQIDKNASCRLIGLDEEVFQHALESLMSAKLIITDKNGAPTLSTNGAKRINRLLNQLADTGIVNAIKESREEVNELILRELETKSLSHDDILKTIPFHPLSTEILHSLSSNNFIHLEGNMYFLGKGN